MLPLAGGADYTELIAENFDVFLTFNDGNRRRRFTVEISDDDLLENIEDFNLELRFDPFLPAPPSGVMLDPGVATVFIQDDICESFASVLKPITQLDT